jgi:hypothetical protein
MKPRKGIIAQQEQDRIEAEQAAGEARYYASVMHDEICDGCASCGGDSDE